MGLVYKDLMGKMGIDDEGLFELAYCELDYISNELQKIYKSPYISDLNSYILFAIRKMLDSWQSIHLLCEDRIDVSSLVTLSRMIVDNYTILHFIHINSKTIEERELRHYLYVLDGVENRIKELRKFPSLTFDLNYIEQTEIDQLAQQIETTMQSDLKAKDQLLKKIRNNPLCNVDMENIIQRRNWKYKKLNNTIKGNRFSWLELYQQAGIKNSVSQFISGYMSEFVHGLCMSNIAYNTPPFEKGQILNINTVFINKRKTPACHRQAGYNWIRGNILRDRSQKPFIFRQITASVSLSFGNYRSKTDCWLWPTSFPFRYSVGEIPTYCLKYLPKKDWVEKFSSEAISLILKSEERSICLASAMTMRMIHCRAEMPDFSLMIAEK